MADIPRRGISMETYSWLDNEDKDGERRMHVEVNGREVFNGTAIEAQAVVAVLDCRLQEFFGQGVRETLDNSLTLPYDPN
jgi:hypothetical protein